MFLPIGDTPNEKAVPYITWALIVINISIFLFVTLPLSSARPDMADPAFAQYLQILGAQSNQVSAYDLLVFKNASSPADISFTGMLYAMFLHGGWMHLAGNMLFLWIFGDNVEHRLGSVFFLLTYLGTGMASTLFFAQFFPQSPVPLIGASGAISGVLGCYFRWFPRNRIKIFLFLYPLVVKTVLVPSRMVLALYLIVNNIVPFLLTFPQGGQVAHGAHIGGFLAGLILAYTFDCLPKKVRRALT